MTEEQAMRERYKLMDDGYYNATINMVTERMSSTNNPMAELTLSVFDKNGEVHTMKDFLVFTTKMMWKLKHAADSANLTKEYENKSFRPKMLEGKHVKVEVKTQSGKEIPEDKLRGKPKGSLYPDRNVINDYVMTDKGAVKYDSKAPAGGHADMNDDIPF
jgi:hypothetical protein